MKTTLSHLMKIAGLLLLLAPQGARAGGDFAAEGPSLQLKLVTLTPELAKVKPAGDGVSIVPINEQLRTALTAAGISAADASHIALVATPSVVPQAEKQPEAAQAPGGNLAAVEKAVTNLPDIAKAEGGDTIQAGRDLSDAVTGSKSIKPTGAVFVGAGDTATLQDHVKWAKGKLDAVKEQLGKVIIGHTEPIRDIVIAMTAQQHVLLEGLPGDGKTQTAKTIANVTDGSFSRIQFTADLLPADIIGSMIFNQKKGDFEFRKGPIFANIVLADELNRAPPKTHSALLEAMGEGHVTVDGKQHNLPRFTVLATQNPVEQEGTYKASEAEMDRFMFKSKYQQPSEDELVKIMRLKRFKDNPPKAEQAATLAELDDIRRVSEKIVMTEEIERYIAKVVMAAKVHEDLKGQVKYSVYTRAAQFLEQAARIRALMDGRDYVSPADVREMAFPVMRHRIALDYKIKDKDADALIQKILDVVQTPKTDGRIAKQ